MFFGYAAACGGEDFLYSGSNDKKFKKELFVLQGNQLTLFRKVRTAVGRVKFKPSTRFDLLDAGVKVNVSSTESSLTPFIGARFGEFEWSLSVSRVTGVNSIVVRTKTQSERDAWVSSLRSKQLKST